MLKLFKWLGTQYKSLVYQKLAMHQSQNSIPATGERRGRPVLLKTYPTKRMVILALNKVIDEQVQSAQEKIAKAGNWVDIGYTKMHVINQVKQLIKSLHDIKVPQDFVTACHTSFKGLIKQWQDNTQDADGYGLATVKTIKRALERQQ